MRTYKSITVGGKQVRVHRYLMQQHLGRPLTHEDIVHHKNGNIHDNAIGNLVLMTRSEHARIHSDVIAIRPKNGRVLKCSVCGKKRYYSPDPLKRLGRLGKYRCSTCRQTLGICRVRGCKRPARYRNSKLCSPHYHNQYYRKNKQKWQQQT
jgi:hypothetical protein